MDFSVLKQAVKRGRFLRCLVAMLVGAFFCVTSNETWTYFPNLQSNQWEKFSAKKQLKWDNIPL